MVLLVGLTGCTKPHESERVLRDQGYTDITIQGYGMFRCDEKDTFSTRFTAKSMSGKYVSGTVCSGLLKGNTIRLD